MKVSEVIELAKEWVEAEAAQQPGFLAAHLGGSLSSLDKEADFPLYRDLDLYLISQAESERQIRPYFHKGLMVDALYSTPRYYQSAAAVLANPHLAHHLAAETIIADPTGMLEALHQPVKRDFARRKWVAARLAYEKKELIEPLLAPAHFTTLTLYLVIMNLGGMIAVAHLKNPTHRRSLILLKEILQEQEDATLHDEALQILGSAHMSQEQVAAYLPDVQEAFRRAVAVYQTPIPHVGIKLRPDREPYYVAASQEMIAEGHHREAMLWIVGTIHLANTAIQNDAPPAEKAYFQAKYENLLHGLGLRKAEDWQHRQQQLQKLTTRFFNFADRMVAGSPSIKD
jgi:hypothetical protein